MTQVKTVKNVVAERVASSGPEIFSKIVDNLANEIVEKRVQQIMQSFTEIDNLTKDLRKFKPDLVSYDIEGVLISESYSKSIIENKKKIQDRINKIEKALEKALDKNDFSDILSLGNGKSD